jgi:hypothetical protein
VRNKWIVQGARICWVEWNKSKLEESKVHCVYREMKGSAMAMAMIKMKRSAN